MAGSTICFCARPAHGDSLQGNIPAIHAGLRGNMMQMLMRVSRRVAAVVAICLWGQAALSDVAVLSIDSQTEGWLNRTTTVTIALDQAIPFRVSAPQDGRVAVTLNGADPHSQPAFHPDTVINRYNLSGAQEGAVISLEAQRMLTLQSASMANSGGAARLTLTFAAGSRLSRSPHDAPRRGATALPLVVLDPGHGGIDPGAVRLDIAEKDIALAFGQELRAVLQDSGRFDVRMTRDTDVFVTLRDRVRFARESGAAVFISLHANTVTRGNASGSAIYTLSEDASSAEAAALAELENRADTLGGVDLGVEDDDLALLLTDMAQRETNARSAMLARATVEAMRHAVGVIRSNPHRSAGFRVLKAPDIPSMLIELGFLSDATDRANMISPRWRAHAAQGILAALDDWVERDRVLSAQVRPAPARVAGANGD